MKQRIPKSLDVFINESSAYSEYMLEYDVFRNGEWVESVTIKRRTLKEINDYMDKNITMDDHKYKLKGWKNGQWETIINKK